MAEVLLQQLLRGLDIFLGFRCAPGIKLLAPFMGSYPNVSNRPRLGRWTPGRVQPGVLCHVQRIAVLLRILNSVGTSYLHHNYT